MTRYGYEYYPPTRPREAGGGIKAQSKRGGFGERWWARRWVEVLESFPIAARLARGRNYARRGQVLSIAVRKGTVKAEVQGSRVSPYKVSIKVKTLTVAEWEKVAGAASGQVLFSAKLMSRDMPPEIEEVFDGLGLSLFPGRYEDLKTSCSCPDWSNPCKHIAAVYYLLGEEFDRDPFLIFRLRGIDRTAFIELMRPQGDKASAGKKPSTRPDEAALPPGEPLPAETRLFWNGGGYLPDSFGEVEVPSAPAALPKSLGGFPFWRGEHRFIDFLEEAYLHSSDRGMEIFLSGMG